MPPGTSVLLYTDGLIERRDESLDAGLERLRSTGEQVLQGTALNDEIADLLGRLIDGPRPADDVALMLLHRDATPATELEFAVDARARSLLTIRRAVSRWLDDLEVPPAVGAGDRDGGARGIRERRRARLWAGRRYHHDQREAREG